jgi:EmrB/QacA subfamily drug resistance transporter
MLLVDITIVQVALPTIQRHLHSNFADLQWVIDAYALTLATLMLTWGAASDRFGRKRIFVSGLVVFTLASLLCALSNSSTFLIWARALQGVGGAAMFATGLALIAQDFQGPERGKAIAAWGATVGGAVAVGPLIGGALTSGFGWRWIFFVNLPIGIVTVLLSISRMVNVRDPKATKLDLSGLVTFSAFMFLLIFGLIRTNTDAWTSVPILALVFSAAVMLMAFIAIELHQPRPMFDLSLFRKPGFTGVCVATFAIGAGMFSLFPYLTFYLQNDLGFSAIGGGIRLLPSTVLCFFVPLCIRSIAEKLPPGFVLGSGLAITALGIATMIAVSATSTWLVLIPGLLLTGFGIGIANPAIARVALGVVSDERSGMASGISNTFRIGGIATGVAALGSVFEKRISSSLRAPLGHSAPQIAKVVASAGVHAAQAAEPRLPGIADAARKAFASGFDEILLIGTVVVATGALAAMALVRARDFHQRPAAPMTTMPWDRELSEDVSITEDANP